MTMMPLSPFALPWVAAPSESIAASWLSQSFSNICMAIAWSDAVSPVFCPVTHRCECLCQSMGAEVGVS